VKFCALVGVDRLMFEEYFWVDILGDATEGFLAKSVIEGVVGVLHDNLNYKNVWPRVYQMATAHGPTADLRWNTRIA
jgi:hypothetical protein